MLIIFFAILIAAFISFVLLIYGYNNSSILSIIGGLIGFFLAISSGISAIAYAYAGWEYIASRYHKSRVPD